MRRSEQIWLKRLLVREMNNVLTVVIIIGTIYLLAKLLVRKPGPLSVQLTQRLISYAMNCCDLLFQALTIHDNKTNYCEQPVTFASLKKRFLNIHDLFAE